MMGRQTADQVRLFYEFHLDDRVSADHLLRRIDVFAATALADLRHKLADLGHDLPLSPTIRLGGGG